MPPYIVSSSNIRSQLGQEASLGAGGSAGTSLRSLIIEPGQELSIREVMGQGHRFDTTTVLDKQWSSFTVSADSMLYTEHLYCLENAFGAAAPTLLGAKTQKRVYTPPLTGGITPKTWTQQWGDPADNVNQYGYGLLTDYGETWDRDKGVKLNGTKGLAQILTTGATFTASPKYLANVPIAGGDWNVYLDTTGAGLGTTQITDEVDSVDWSITGLKDVRWAANRAYASFSGYKEQRPKTALKITFAESSTTRAIIAALIGGQSYFLRLDGQGPLIESTYYYQARRDFALRVQKVAAFKDNSGVYAREVDFVIVEDTTWGNAVQLTSQTQEASL